MGGDVEHATFADRYAVQEIRHAEVSANSGKHLIAVITTPERAAAAFDVDLAVGIDGDGSCASTGLAKWSSDRRIWSRWKGSAAIVYMTNASRRLKSDEVARAIGKRCDLSRKIEGWKALPVGSVLSIQSSCSLAFCCPLEIQRLFQMWGNAERRGGAVLRGERLWLSAAGYISFIVIVAAAFPVALGGDPDTLSKWGGYAQGIFAPLAFFWLMLAVFLQSQELRAQREELQLTRAELEAQRDVMSAQADEARKQAASMEAQTELLLRGTTDEEFQTHLRLLRDWARSNLVHEDTVSLAQTVGNRFMLQRVEEGHETFFNDITRLVWVSSLEGPGDPKAAKWALDHTPIEAVIALFERLSAIAAMKPRLSGGSKAIFEASSIELALNELHRRLEPVFDQLDIVVNKTFRNVFNPEGEPSTS